MNISTRKKSFRWVLLRHTGDPYDSKGIHFDLLLEDTDFCRSWRLSEIPIIDGSYVSALQINPHRLDWLDIKEKSVSGNRGLATRVKKGIYFKSFQSIKDGFECLSVIWDEISVELILDKHGCKILTQKK